QIRIPSFRYGKNEKSGVGQGDGAVGTPIGSTEEEGGGAKAGDSPGQHLLEVDITLDELAQILGEALELPRIKPKGQSSMLADRDRYTGVAQAGPESLRHFKRTYVQALKRSVAMGLYDEADPIIVPHREDKRYRARRIKEVPQNN